jgi:small subunit ribosomal protein S17
MKIKRGLRKDRVGRVVSTRMSKTVLVDVERLMKHPLYGKVIRRSKWLMAHDEKGECHEGDTVLLAETRPLSKRKRWRVVKVLGKAE